MVFLLVSGHWNARPSTGFLRATGTALAPDGGPTLGATSREFFLNYAVRNSTVPLLLALMPTLGLSVLSWAGQLGGAALGVLYAGLIMLIWRGIGRQAYCVPGLFFFEWFLCLGVGWRMLNGPDFLAVTSMNACAIVRPLSYSRVLERDC
jgi:hypothetical protein